MNWLDLGTFASAMMLPPARAQAWLASMNVALERWSIADTHQRAMFIAQVGHESASLSVLEERWGNTTAQQRYERDFDCAWPPTDEDTRNRVAWMLGNSERGDGRLYCGHGPIQITGRENHRQAGVALGIDALANPLMLCTTRYGLPSAGWFWHSRGCNELARLGTETAFEMVTKRINGGLNGYADRLVRWKRALDVLAS